MAIDRPDKKNGLPGEKRGGVDSVYCVFDQGAAVVRLINKSAHRMEPALAITGSSRRSSGGAGGAMTWAEPEPAVRNRGRGFSAWPCSESVGRQRVRIHCCDGGVAIGSHQPKASSMMVPLDASAKNILLAMLMIFPITLQ